MDRGRSQRPSPAAPARRAVQLAVPAGFSDRLDRALASLIDGMSRGDARRLIAAGGVFVDGRRCRVASRTVHGGTRLRVEPPVAPPATPALVILYEDADCMAIDKPAGMPSCPTRQAAHGTAIEVLRAVLRQRTPPADRLWLVHRLDHDTSGVLLFARTRTAAGVLNTAFRDGHVDKEYVAWVDGIVAADSGTVDAPLRQVGHGVVVRPDGRQALTRWDVLRRDLRRTLVRLLPATGRMHQLRVHMQSIGHPIAGDRRYGGTPAPRLMLHASRLRLRHPGSADPLEIVAPVPPELA